MLDAYVNRAEKKRADSAAALDNAPESPLAKSAHQLALAECESVVRRAAAMRAAWEEDEVPGQLRDEQSETLNQAVRSAIHANRQVTVARARHSVSKAEADLNEAAEEKKDALQKKLNAAHKSLADSEEKLQSPINAGDRFEPLSGGKMDRHTFSEFDQR